MRFLLVLSLTVLAAGCMGHAEPKSALPAPTTTDPYSLPEGVDNILRGRVSDPDQTPLMGANVEIISLQMNQTTDGAGAFEFRNLEPHDYLVVVSYEGYRTKTQRAIVEDGRIFELNFQLEQKPNLTPYNETTPFRGVISCEFAYATNPENVETVSCGGQDPNNKQAKTFHVNQNAAQIQIEAVWQRTAESSKNLAMTIESVGFGHQDIQFGRQHGDSGIKMTISQTLAQKYYANGGDVLVTMNAAPSVTGDEAALDAGLAVQQDFDLYFTVFYIEPGPPTFRFVPE
jgi:hypothetical protein